MAEHLRHQPEHQSNKGSTELERSAAERIKQLEHLPERTLDRQRSVEIARQQLEKAEQMVSHAQEAAPRVAQAIQRPLMTQATNFKQTMTSLQHRMKPGARRFSRIIHRPSVEAASEVIGKTVLRPSVSIGATTCAVLVTGVIYLYARSYGFQLQGSEIWISLIIGGILGLLIEALYRSIQKATGRLR
jgi:membrane-bound ClpP family serine protease